jgi:hypothetical protein
MGVDWCRIFVGCCRLGSDVGTGSSCWCAGCFSRHGGINGGADRVGWLAATPKVQVKSGLSQAKRFHETDSQSVCAVADTNPSPVDKVQMGDLGSVVVDLVLFGKCMAGWWARGSVSCRDDTPSFETDAELQLQEEGLASHACLHGLVSVF